MLPKDFIAHGSLTISNTGGIEIMLDDSGDGFYYRFSYGQNLDEEEILEAEILYDDYGEAYFMHGECKYFLNEVMRVTQ